MDSSPQSASRVYHVREVLGRGGFGTVYSADLVGEGGFTKAVALKVLHPEAAARPDHLARLRDEARMLGLVRHRALVGADALVRLDGRWTVVMEYVPGVSLRALHKRMGALPSAVVVAIGVEVADALHAAYTAEVEPGRPLRLIHRDVKPSNLQLTARGELKVLDFGVARAEFDQREAHTQQVVYGSPPYLSPERLEGTDSHAGDIFALGISLGELLSGRSAGPVAARPNPHQARIEALLEGVSLESPLGPLLQRMLAYDDKARPTAEEVVAVLRPLARQQSGALEDWSAIAVPRELKALGETPGELTGRRLQEESAATELQALAAGALTTWDDPAQSAGARGRPTPVPDATSTWDADLADLVIPPIHLESPPPAPASSRMMRWLTALSVAAGGALLLLVVAGIVVATMVGTAGVAVLGFIDDRGCEGGVRTMELNIEACKGDAKWQAESLDLAERAARACATNELGLVGISLLMEPVQRVTKDRQLDRDDYQALKKAFDRALPPAP